MNRRKALDRFYAKIHTPVQPTDAADKNAVAENAARMEQFEHRKLFPGTSWEIHKPQKMDYLDFFGAWGLVGVIILILWTITQIGA